MDELTDKQIESARILEAIGTDVCYICNSEFKKEIDAFELYGEYVCQNCYNDQIEMMLK